MNSYKEIFSKLTVSTPEDLKDKVFEGIALSAKKQARNRAIISVIGGLASISVLVYAFLSVKYSLSHTGFTSFVSLLFTDGGVLMGSWKEFVSLLAESLPVGGLIFVFLSILGLVTSIRLPFTNRHLMQKQFNY